MKSSLLTVAAATLAMTASFVGAQVAGSATVGMAPINLAGWSARKQIIGRDVYNEDGDKVGKVEDLIVTPGNAISFAIVGAGGFVGLRRHHVAIPVSELSPRGGDFVLPGATKAAIKSLPAFNYED